MKSEEQEYWMKHYPHEAETIMTLSDLLDETQDVAAKAQIDYAIGVLRKKEMCRWHDLRKDPDDLPDELTNVNVAWINHNPPRYYDFIKDKITSGDSAIFYRGKWWWYSCACVDLLAEYGFSRGDEVDKDIEIIAWRYIEPFEEDNE